MRKFVRIQPVLLLLLMLLTAFAAPAQIRGTGRLQGNIFDKSTGKPVAGATVTIGNPSGNTRPIVTKTDSRGHWAAIGMTSGQWNVDISAAGYVTSRGTATISEVNTPPPIRTELEPEAKQAPVEAAVAAPSGTSLPKEAVDAIREGQDLIKATGTADEIKANAKRAVADFEKALPMIPDDKPELRDVKNQVLQVLAQAYYKEGDLKDSIATFEKLDAVDPAGATPDAAHTTRDVLLANLYLENGQLDQGKALLDKLPASAISDPTAYINIGILFLNKNNAADAVTYFTRAIDRNATSAEGYYYRGLAEVQMKKYSAAKADLQKVVALAPDAPEATEAKQMLANLK